MTRSRCVLPTRFATHIDSGPARLAPFSSLIVSGTQLLRGGTLMPEACSAQVYYQGGSSVVVLQLSPLTEQVYWIPALVGKLTETVSALAGCLMLEFSAVLPARLAASDC